MTENQHSPFLIKEHPIPTKNGAGLTSHNIEFMPANAQHDAVHEVLETPGEPLNEVICNDMGARFGHDFSRVRIHNDVHADKSAQGMNAEAYTAGMHIIFRAGRYAPATENGKGLLTHELIHIVQQGSLPLPARGQAMQISEPGDPSEQQAAYLSGNFTSGLPYHPMPIMQLATAMIQRQPTSMTAIPQSERSVIQTGIFEVTVPASRLDQYFPSSANNRTVTEGETPAARVVFSSTIPQNLQDGLKNVSGYIANRTNALPLNTTINVALDLTPYGGANNVYRFTHYAHTENRVTTNYMLIEEVGATPAAPAAATATTGTFSVGGQDFTLSSRWSDGNFALLRQAIGMLPGTSLSAAAGLTFQYRSGRGPEGEAGKYEPDTDTVILYGNAFTTTSLRTGTAPFAARNILHEIGHALDLRELRDAWNTFTQAGQTPAASRTFLRARSLSGSRYLAPTSEDDRYTADVNIDAPRDGDFRNAVRRDNVRRDTSGRMIDMGGGEQVQAGLSGGATSYSDVDYEEMFAESFALYSTDPTLLQQLRPNTYQYFLRRYPR